MSDLDCHNFSESFVGRFSHSLKTHFPFTLFESDIAVAVSGGPDSMALCFALSVYCAEYYPAVMVHALTVDHGLREESMREAHHVAEMLEPLSNVSHHILEWTHGEKPTARIQEKARAARYDLMGAYMQEHGIAHLFTGHHMDDQAETFLFRLAKGSGLDGLSCMSYMQEMNSGVVLCRPMLDMDKVEILSFCHEQGISFVDDPSNESHDFARVRLRQSMDILREEGLSSKRLSVTAMRLARSRVALEEMADQVFSECLDNNKSDRIVFEFSPLVDNPEEIVLRVILKAMSILRPGRAYAARLERVESLCADLMSSSDFRKRTLGGVIFEHDKKNDYFILSLESRSRD